ncbi:signal peptidase II [Thermodesulfovibrionales bacterium]|nr:signal peptidase II [Thermodesulfovibrionales bacterium]
MLAHRRHVSPLYFLLISLSVLILDQVTKHLVMSYVMPFDVIRVLPFLNIIYVTNPGGAFGLFRGLGVTFFIVVSSLAIVVMAVLFIYDKVNRLSYSLLLGGAAGNITDRISYGHVVDFLDIHVGGFHWPTFNVADSALLIGFFLLLFYVIFGGKTHRP